MTFIGREMQFRDLKLKLTLFSQVLISGPGGSGKTAFVKQFLQNSAVVQTEVIWLNFGLPDWPYKTEKSQIFEDYFSALYDARLAKYKYVIIDQTHKLSAPQFSFLKSFVEQLMSDQKFLFIASEQINYFQNQIIKIEEFDTAEAELFFKIYFPNLNYGDYSDVLRSRRYLPQEILFLPHTKSSNDSLHLDALTELQLEILKYLSLIDKSFTQDELKLLFSEAETQDILQSLNKKYFLRMTESEDRSEISAAVQIRNHFQKSLCTDEKKAVYLKHVRSVEENKISDLLIYKYLIALDDETALLNYLSRLSTQTLNQIPTGELSPLADYILKLTNRPEFANPLRQKTIQVLLLAGKRDQSIQLAQLWLQEWVYPEKISESESAYIYELIHLLNRSDLYKAAEKALNFYLNRIGGKYKFLLRLETVLVILKDDPKAAIQSLERVLADYTENKKQFDDEEKKILAHIYFQLGRAESISKNFEKCRSYYTYSEKYYTDCGLTYYASISALNFSWTYFTERNFPYLQASLGKLHKNYSRFGFLLTRFGYEILTCYAHFFSLEFDEAELHLSNAKKLLKNDIPQKPKIDFYKLSAFVSNLNFDFTEAETSYAALCGLISQPSELEQSSTLIGRPNNSEQLLDYRQKKYSDYDFVLLQLLMLGHLEPDSLTPEEVTILKKSKFGNQLYAFLSQEPGLSSDNFPALLKKIGHSKTFYSHDEVLALAPHSQWTGHQALSKYFHIAQQQVIVKSYRQEFQNAKQADLYIDDVNREVYFKKSLLEELGGRNTLYKFLKALVSQAPQDVSKESLAVIVWNSDYDPGIHDSRIYTCVQRLRKILGPKNIQQSDAAYRLNPKISCSIRLPNINESQATNVNTHAILELLRSYGQMQDPWISKNDILIATGLSLSTVKRALIQLINDNLIIKKTDSPVHIKYKIR